MWNASNPGHPRAPIGIWKKGVSVEEITAAFNVSHDLLNECGVVSSSCSSYSGCLGTPLLAAALNGNFEVAKTLVHYNVDIDAPTVLRKDLLQHSDVGHSSCTIHWTPLHVAISFGHADIVKLLVENGAQLSCQTNVSCNCWPSV